MNTRICNLTEQPYANGSMQKQRAATDICYIVSMSISVRIINYQRTKYQILA